MDPRSPWSPTSAPPAPLPLTRLCSPASSLQWRGLTSQARASSASAPHIPDAGSRPRQAPAVRLEISRSPNKERAGMPGSSATPGHADACDGAPVRDALRATDSISTRIEFLAQLNGWPARTPVNASPCTLRCAAHDSRSTGLATPLLQGTCTLCSLPVCRRNRSRPEPMARCSVGASRPGGIEANLHIVMARWKP
jgi:hypothetical protein